MPAAAPCVRAAARLARPALAMPRPLGPCVRTPTAHLRRLCSKASVAPEPPLSLRLRLAKAISLPTLGLSWIVHIGNSIFLLSIFQTDMMNLRMLAVSGTLFNVCFLALQPVPLISSAVWSTFFTSTHLYQIFVLYKEKQTTALSEEQEKAYELAFLPYGFTPRQYLDVLEQANGRWCTFRKGDVIQAKGEEMAHLHVVLDGVAEFTDAHSTKERSPGKGGWLGELFDPSRRQDYWNQPHQASFQIVCHSETCSTLAFDRKALDVALHANPRLAEAATRAELADLWGKVHSAGPERKQRMFASMLEIALSDGDLHPTERKQIDRFREKYTISEAKLAAELTKLGWSLDDYAKGRK